MIQTRLRICLWGRLNEFLEREIGRGDKVIARELVSIHHGETDGVGLFMFHDLENHLFVVDWIQVVTNNGCSEGLSPKRCDDEGVHVE